MLRCKQVSQALASSKYWDLPLRKRIGLRMHVVLCLVCGPFNRFVMLMQDASRHYRKHEMNGTPPDNMKLPDDAKQRIQEALAREANQDASPKELD